MARLMIHELPRHPEADGTVRVLRHWLTLDDGRIFYQDETITMEFLGSTTESQRGEWVQLPTPPSAARIVGLVDYGGLPLALRSDGECFTIGRAISPDVGGIDAWVRMMDPVPLGDVE